MKEKIKMKKIYIKIIVGIIIVLIIGFLSNPFWWGMQSSIVQQPKLSDEEVEYFKSEEIDVDRYYKNITTDGRDTLFADDYDKKPFDYMVAFYRSKDNFESIVLEKDSVYRMAKYIKNKMFKNNKNLRNIVIWDAFNEYSFSVNDSIFLTDEH